MSFKLMSVNSAQCPDMEEAQRQLDSHLALVRDIADQQRCVDNVGRQGRRLADENPGNSELKQEIDSQLVNLGDSYNNLKETAEQIQERLKENLAKWKTYKDLLHNADRFLQSDLSSWWMGKDPISVRSLSDVDHQIQDTKTMQAKLQQLRNDINSAAFKCEVTAFGPDRPPSRAGGTPRRSASPMPGSHSDLTESSLSRLSEKVVKAINSQLEKMDRRLGDLGGLRDKWDKLSLEEQEFADWLKERERQAASTDDLDALERLRDEIASRPISQSLMESNPELKNAQDSLLRRLGNLINQKRMAAQQAEDFRRKKIHVDEEIEVVMNKFTRSAAQPQTLNQADILQLADRSTQTICHQKTQTPRQTPSTSLHDLTDTRLYDNVSPASSLTNLPDGYGNLRNSGGHTGISKQMWPYKTSWDKYKDDPIESLRKTLVEMEAKDEAMQTPRHRRTQTDQNEAPAKSNRPSRAAALKSLISTVKGLKDDLEHKQEPVSHSYDSELGSTMESIRRPPEPMGLSENNLPVNLAEAKKSALKKSPTSSAKPSRGSTPRSSPSKTSSPNKSLRPQERPVSPSPRRHTPHPPIPSQSSPSASTKAKRTINNKYGLDPDKFDMYIPTKPHWREGPLANGDIPVPLLTPTPPPQATNQIAPAPTPAQLTRQFIRDYDHMLHDTGNKKHHSRSRSSRPGVSDSLDKASRSAQDMKNLTERMRKSVM